MSAGVGTVMASETDTPFKLTRDWPYLSLALPQMWLYVMLRALGSTSGAASPVAFYAAEALALLAALLIFRNQTGPGKTHVCTPALAWPCSVAAALCPALACLFAETSVPVVVIAQLIGGAGLAWSYLAYFQTCSGLPTRRAIWCLLLAFAAVPALRLPLDLLPLLPACLIVIVCLPLFAALVCHAMRKAARDESTSARSAIEDVRTTSGILPLLMQAVAFGFVMGLFRIDASGAQDSPTLALVLFGAKLAFPLIVLLATERLWQRVSMATICQTALALITVTLVVGMNLPQLPAVMFGVFDFARYVMVVLVFLSATSLARRYRSVHSVAVLAGAMGTYVAALAIGLAISRLAGFTQAISATVALDVVCVLMVVILVAGNIGSDTDARLFSDGSAENAPAETGDIMDARCDKLATCRHLAPREVEVMKLICRGRSKRYIAEQLALSENTVRGYAKTLYAKLDIHSRQELLTLLGID